MTELEYLHSVEGVAPVTSITEMLQNCYKGIAPLSQKGCMSYEDFKEREKRIQSDFAYRS